MRKKRKQLKGFIHVGDLPLVIDQKDILYYLEESITTAIDEAVGSCVIRKMVKAAVVKAISSAASPSVLEKSALRGVRKALRDRFNIS